MVNFKVTKQSETGQTTTFVLEPLEAGFGHTVGNCLRRVMLSSLEGAAISTVKINGASHQFSTIPGVSEDVIEIILNLKKVRIRSFSDKPFRATLNASGKTEVKASDLDLQGGGEVVNPNLHIASLSDAKAKLTIDMTVEKGVGYVGADEKKSNEIGVMPIDSIFSPVISANYIVEPTRVGRQSNLDKVVLEVETDGTISAEDALNQSSRLLSAYFKQIYDPTLQEDAVVEGPKVSDDVLKMSVDELDLPVRITNALKAIDIDEIETLITTPRVTLMKAKNLGSKSLSLISEKLSERGLSLSEA